MYPLESVKRDWFEACSHRKPSTRYKAMMIMRLKCSRTYAEMRGWIGKNRDVATYPPGFPPGWLDRMIALLKDPNVSDIRKSFGLAMCEVYDPNWKSLIPSEVLPLIVDRNSFEVRTWRASVLKRDKYRCQRCPSVKDLHAHHIAFWSEFPLLRIDVDNGLTLCQPCHAEAHR